MSLLPEIKNGILLSVEIPQTPKVSKRLSKKMFARVRGIERRAKRKHKRKPKKQKTTFVTTKYKEYIKSGAWMKRKEQYFKKFGKECAICKSPYRIGLHHISYRHVGRELDEELVALCWTHHSAYHDQEGVKRDNSSTHTFIEEERQVLELKEITKSF